MIISVTRNPSALTTTIIATAISGSRSTAGMVRWKSKCHRIAKSTFEPQVVKKRQKDISDIDQKIISMYAKGMTTRQISETIEDIYGFETSESFISDVTDKILPQIEDWQNRPLDEVYPILYIDAIHYSVRDNGVIRKACSLRDSGHQHGGQKGSFDHHVLATTKARNTGFPSMNELKNRGVKDVS